MGRGMGVGVLCMCVGACPTVTLVASSEGWGGGVGADECPLAAPHLGPVAASGGVEKLGVEGCRHVGSQGGKPASDTKHINHRAPTGLTKGLLASKHPTNTYAAVRL